MLIILVQEAVGLEAARVEVDLVTRAPEVMVLEHGGRAAVVLREDQEVVVRITVGNGPSALVVPTESLNCRSGPRKETAREVFPGDSRSVADTCTSVCGC